MLLHFAWGEPGATAQGCGQNDSFCGPDGCPAGSAKRLTGRHPTDSSARGAGQDRRGPAFSSMVLSRIPFGPECRVRPGEKQQTEMTWQSKTRTSVDIGCGPRRVMSHNASHETRERSAEAVGRRTARRTGFSPTAGAPGRVPPGARSVRSARSHGRCSAARPGQRGGP